MAKPYVYLCTHIETKRFYIGYRRANNFSANDDLGIHYFTSSKEVRKNFSEYKFEILSEYDSPLMAYEVEQLLIYENRHNPLLINKNYKVSNHITLDPKPVTPTSDYYENKKKSAPRYRGPSKRSERIPRTTAGRKREKRRSKKLQAIRNEYYARMSNGRRLLETNTKNLED